MFFTIETKTTCPIKKWSAVKLFFLHETNTFSYDQNIKSVVLEIFVLSQSEKAIDNYLLINFSQRNILIG